MGLQQQLGQRVDPTTQCSRQSSGQASRLRRVRLDQYREPLGNLRTLATDSPSKQQCGLRLLLAIWDEFVY